MSELKPGNKLLEFLSVRSKKIIISIIVPVAIIAMGFIFYFGYWTQRPQYVVAKVGDTAITRGELKSNIDFYKKYFAYSNNKDIKNFSNVDTTVRDILIEKTVVTAEAAKRGVSVSDKEVADRLALLQKSYKNYDDMIKTYSAAYGFNETDIHEVVRYALLREKIEALVVSKKDVTFLYFRYDFPGKDALTLATTAATESLGRINSGSTLGNEYARVKSQNNPVWAMPNSGLSTLKDLNKENAADIFEGNEDWPAIDALTRVGSTTGMVKSSGGYIAIYKLDSLNDGKYANWAAFVASYPQKITGKISFDILSKISTPAFACVSNLTYNTSTGYCNVPGYANDQAHYSRIFGVVRDGLTGYALNGVNVTATRVIDPSLTPPLDTSTSQGSFSAASYTWGPGGTPVHTVPGYYMLGNQSGSKLIPCYWAWDVTTSVAGYMPWGTRVTLTNGQDSAVYPYVTPARTLSVGVVTDTNNDNVYEPTSVGGKVVWTDHICPDTACSAVYYHGTTVNIVANASAGYQFVGFRFIYSGIDYTTADGPETINTTNAPGVALHTSNPHGVYLDRDWQAIAYFSKLPTLSIGIMTDFNDGRGYVGDSTGGNVKTADGKISCVPTCSATYNLNDFTSTVETPAAGYEFVKWDTTDSGGGVASYTVPTIGTNMTLSKGFTAFFRKSAPATPPPTPTLSCTVSPPNGETPLVVRVSANPGGGVTGPYSYKMNAGRADELVQNSKPSPFWYTYSTAGTYTVQISSPSYQGGATWETCSAINSSGTSSNTVTVSDPTSTTGGEVRP